MEGGHKLGHGCHRNGAGEISADAATNSDTADDQGPSQWAVWHGNGEGGEDGEAHADHAVKVAFA